MGTIFPEPILNLPEADIPLKGIHTYLSQGDNHQIIFMESSEDIDLPEHSHASQVGIVLEGKIDLIIDGVKNSYQKGDRYFIPNGIKNSRKIYAGYADITFLIKRIDIILNSILFKDALFNSFNICIPYSIFNSVNF